MKDFQFDVRSGDVTLDGKLVVNTRRDSELLCGAYESSGFGRTETETAAAVWLGLRVE